MTGPQQCPTCGEPVGEGDEFCENCGAQLSGHAETSPVTAAAHEAAEDAPERDGVETEPSVRKLPPCDNCGAAGEMIDADGYCGNCGYRQPRPTDHLEVELDGLAAVSDKGLRHHRNEDAVALRIGEGWRVLVVCDGVSTTANPDLASAVAAVAIADEVAARAAEGGAATAAGAAQVLVDALASAQQAVLAVPAHEPGGYPQAPSTTVAAAVVTSTLVASANVGDSRSYWVDTSNGGPVCHQLGRDDSLAEEAIAAGASPDEAYADRSAHTIIRWLGADAPALAPNTATTAPTGPGFVLVCSDGLWNYYPTPDALGELLAAAPEGETSLALARRLTQAAIVAGGHDNITVAIAPVGIGQSPPAEASVTEPPAPEPGPVEPGPVTEE